MTTEGQLSDKFVVLLATVMQTVPVMFMLDLKTIVACVSLGLCSTSFGPQADPQWNIMLSVSAAIAVQLVLVLAIAFKGSLDMSCATADLYAKQMKMAQFKLQET